MWEGINPKHAKLTYFWCAPSQGEPGTFCESHIEGEVLDPLSTLRKVEGVKAASSAYVLDGARSAAAVSAGLRVITYVHHLLFHLSGRP